MCATRSGQIRSKGVDQLIMLRCSAAKLDRKDLDLDLQQHSLDRKKIIQILDLSLDPNALFIQIFQILRTKFQVFWIFRAEIKIYLKFSAQNLDILGPRIQIQLQKKLSWIHCHIRILGIRRKRRERASNEVQLKTKRRGRVKSIEI